MAATRTPRFVTVGKVSGVYGVRGWVRIYSYTEPREAILEYVPWWLSGASGWVAHTLAEGRRHGKGVVARLEGCTDRDAAGGWVGREIAVRREQLPDPGPDGYYWVDLVGLRVVTRDGRPLGTVSRLLETGANDVLVVQGEREQLIPFAIGSVVRAVDRERGVIEVDWEPDF